MIGADDAPEERLFPSNPSEPQADMTARCTMSSSLFKNY